MCALIKSTSYDQVEIIKNILQLHTLNGLIDVDTTYSVGNFYKNTGIPEPRFKFDINPQIDGVEYADSRAIPLEDESVKCVMFDPPFLATKGPSLTDGSTSNKINRRFGVYETEKLLHQYYIDSLRDIYRILEFKGILIFKCQDKVSSGKQYMTHCFIYNEAVKAGFYCKDMFVLLAKSRLTADWQAQNQKTARKYHSYFYVFEKSNKVTKYV